MTSITHISHRFAQVRCGEWIDARQDPMSNLQHFVSKVKRLNIGSASGSGTGKPWCARVDGRWAECDCEACCLRCMTFVYLNASDVCEEGASHTTSIEVSKAAAWLSLKILRDLPREPKTECGQWLVGLDTVDSVST